MLSGGLEGAFDGDAGCDAAARDDTVVPTRDAASPLAIADIAVGEDNVLHLSAAFELAEQAIVVNP